MKRLGCFKISFSSFSITEIPLGKYYLLGNILNVVTDRKLPVADANDNTKVAYFTADVVSYSDYLPFGQVMPNRHGYTGAKYRFGFQAQEVDDELKGEDNSVNFEFRMHDPRLGRFFAVDPLEKKYPHNSPYAFSQNRVIDGVELEGLEVHLIGKNTTVSAIISGEVEGGLAIGPKGDGVYAYGSWAVGIETNVSASSSISYTYFPKMPAAKFLEGSGAALSVSCALPIPLVGISGGVAYSSGYAGYNLSVGLGAGVVPVSVSLRGGQTSLRPLTTKAEINTGITLLTDMKSKMRDEINGQRSLYHSLDAEINEKVKDLKDNGKGSWAEVKKLQKERNKVYDNIKDMREKVKEMDGAINTLKTAKSKIK